MSIQIIRPVTVKARVTEGLKDRLAGEMNQAIKMLDEELEQLDAQVRRAQLAGTIPPQQQMQLRQLVEQEKAKRADKKEQLQDEIKAVYNLPLGSEIVQATAQSLINVEVGTDFDALMEAEILLQDGKIIEIREGGKK